MGTIARLRKLEAKARLDSSIRNLTDEQLFSAYLGLVERGGGAETFAASPEADGDRDLARSVLALSACQTAAEFMVSGA